MNDFICLNCHSNNQTPEQIALTCNSYHETMYRGVGKEYRNLYGWDWIKSNPGKWKETKITGGLNEKV